jgi:hypothetical protein
MTAAKWRFYRWLLRVIHDAERMARDERLTGLSAFHDAITDNLLWRIE